MRYAFEVEPLMKLLLLPFGGTPENCFAAIEAETLHVKMGWLFDHHLPLANIRHVGPDHWPMYLGLGVRLGFKGTYGVIASGQQVVSLQFRTPQPLKSFGPLRFKARQLFLALEQDKAFIAALRERLQHTP